MGGKNLCRGVSTETELLSIRQQIPAVQSLVIREWKIGGSFSEPTRDRSSFHFGKHCCLKLTFFVASPHCRRHWHVLTDKSYQWDIRLIVRQIRPSSALEATQKPNTRQELAGHTKFQIVYRSFCWLLVGSCMANWTSQKEISYEKQAAIRAKNMFAFFSHL